MNDWEWKIIKWLKGQGIEFSQFTIDWIEAKIDIYHTSLEDGLLTEKNFTGGVIYDARNILEIMRPDVPDVEFFKKLILYFDHK